MKTKLKHSHQLIQQSMQFVFKRKSLLLIAFLSSLTILLLLAFVLSPLMHYEKEIITQHAKTETIVWIYVGVLLFLFLVHQISFYFSAALISCISTHLKGNNISVKKAIKTANKRFFKLFLWNLYRSSVGLIVVLFYSRIKNTRFYEKIFYSLRWSILCRLSLPIIVENNTYPHEAAKRSAELIRKNWGSNLKTNFGFIPFMIAARILSILPVLIASLTGEYKNILIGAAVSFFIVLIISVILSSTQTTLSCILYHYASTRTLSPEFNEKLIEQAFIKQ